MGNNRKYKFVSAPYQIDRKLYKYFSNMDYAIKCIENRQIHLDDPRSFNDPFDSAFSFPQISTLAVTDSEREMFLQIIKSIALLPKDKQTEKHLAILQSLHDTSISKMNSLSSEDTEQPVIRIIEKIYSLCETNLFTLQELTEEIDKSFEEKERTMYINCRVSCFSEVNDSILMWSYYANRHKGVCLEFDLSKLDIKKRLNKEIIRNLSRVHYSPIRADVQYLLENNSGLNFLTTKANVWEHELEWRLICETKEEFIPLDCISGIYLGVNFPIQSKTYTKLQKAVDTYPALPIYQGKLSLTKYEIEYREYYNSSIKTYLKSISSK